MKPDLSSSLPPGVESRAAALALLSATLDRRWPLEVPEGNLSPADRGFALLLAKTCLRRLGQLDDALRQFLESPLPPNALRLRHLLRLGLVQLLFLDTPPHAAVHSTVELAKVSGLRKFTGLANAIFQRAAREKETVLAAQDAARLNTPGWLWRSWAEEYGEALCRAIAESHLQEPPLDLTVKEDAAGWAARLDGVAVNAHTVRLNEAGNVAALPGYGEGAWWVQDASAALPARILLEALGDAHGKNIVDLCAAPGGKTAQLALAGAEVTAVDISENRLIRLRENMARLGLHAHCVAADALQWQPSAPPDAILLDAPCSSTGTIRRHPEIARHRSLEDAARLAALQQKLLSRAWEWLKPGGILCYSVCSIQPEEGRKQLAPRRAMLQKERIPYADSSPADGDGFYVAVLVKS